MADLHLWYLSQGSLAVMLSVVTHYPRSPKYYKNLLKHIPSLAHVAIEVNPCDGKACLPLTNDQRLLRHTKD